MTWKVFKGPLKGISYRYLEENRIAYKGDFVCQDGRSVDVEGIVNVDLNVPEPTLEKLVLEHIKKSTVVKCDTWNLCRDIHG